MGRRSSRSDGSQESPRRNGSRWLAENKRLARHARQRSNPATMDLHGSETRGAGVFARDRATSADARVVEVVEGRAPWSFSRLQPECKGSHDVFRLLDTTTSRRASLRAAFLGGNPQM